MEKKLMRLDLIFILLTAVYLFSQSFVEYSSKVNLIVSIVLFAVSIIRLFCVFTFIRGKRTQNEQAN